MQACLRRSHVLREHEWIASFARHANGQTSAERTPASLMLRVPVRGRSACATTRPTEPRMTGSIVLVQRLDTAGRTPSDAVGRGERAAALLASAAQRQSRAPSDCELRLRVARRHSNFGSMLESAGSTWIPQICRGARLGVGAFWRIAVPHGSVCASSREMLRADRRARSNAGSIGVTAQQQPSGLVGRGRCGVGDGAWADTAAEPIDVARQPATARCEHCMVVPPRMLVRLQTLEPLSSARRTERWPSG